MDQETLSLLSLNELKALCRNREIRTTSKTTKPAAIGKILNYHKQHHYKSLKFKENINIWRKDELIPEAKAVGADGVSSMRKREIVNVIINKHSPSKSKLKNKKENKKQNKNIKTKKRTKLNQKVEDINTLWQKMENIMISVFNDLRSFKSMDDNKNNDKDNFIELSDDLIDELETFSDKILPLLPLILEAKSLVHDFQEYHQKITKKSENNKNKNVYYIGMKKFKRTKDIEQDEIGPFCGIFKKIKDFDKWKNDKKIKKKYPKMERIRFVAEDNDDDNDEEQYDLEMESEHEEEKDEEDEDDGSIASEQQKVEEDDLMISSEEDQDEEDQDEEDQDEEDQDEEDQDEEDQDEEDQDEEDEETEDEDHDIDINKNKNKKKTGLSQSTRSRRKRKRENDHDKEIGNDKKRARLNEFASVQISG